MNSEVNARSRSRMGSSSLLVRNATLNLATQAWIFCVLILAMPRLVAWLGAGPFGLFSLTWATVAYLSFLDFGVNRAATKYVSEHLAEQDRQSARHVVRTAVVTNLSIGLLGGVVVASIAPLLVRSVFKVEAAMQPQARAAFYFVGIAVPVLLAQGAFRAVLMSFQKFGLINAVEAAATTLQWGTAVFLAAKGQGVAAIVLSAVVIRLIAASAYAVGVSRLFPDLALFGVDSLRGVSKLLRFGGWVTVSQVVSPLLVYIDRLMIAALNSLAAVTFYAVPFEAMLRLRIVPSALVDTLYPAFSERGGDKDSGLQSLYQRSIRYLLPILTCGMLYLFVLGPDLFTAWMGQAFALHVSVVLRILVLGVFVNALAPVPYNLLQALGRPDITGKFHLAELPLHVLLCVLLIPKWGISGAAAASTIRMAIDSALLFWAAGRYCGCSLRFVCAQVLPRIAPLAAILLFGLFGIRMALNGPWARLGAGAIASLAWLALAWAVVVEKQERQRINGILTGFLGRGASEQLSPR